MKNNKEVAIIGGGASGLFCAILLKEYISNMNVTIYEAQNKVGKKILQTGNGKCNICNMNISTANYNTDKIDNLIKTFKPNDLINILNRWGLMIRVDEEGRVYPYSEKATTVLDIFLKKINEYNINVNTSCYISKINVDKDNKYTIYSSDNKKYISDYLIVCTGGSSSITYNNNGYKLLESLGHSINNLYPSLCALKTKENTKHLSGIRVKCKASIIVNDTVKHQTKGEVLFKDDGLSGIAIFILSQFFEKNKKNIVSLDLYEEKTIDELNKALSSNNNSLDNTAKLETKLMGYFPKMVNQDLINRNKINNNIGYTIKNYTFEIKDTYGFNTSQVTKGGIKLDEIDLKNFSSLKQENLYISGEVLDVDGTCGGYNLYFAFASANSIVIDITNKLLSNKL